MTDRGVIIHIQYAIYFIDYLFFFADWDKQARLMIDGTLDGLGWECRWTSTTWRNLLR